MIIELPEIGKTEFRKNKRAKHLKLSYKPFEHLVVTVPYLMSFKYAAEYLDSNRERVNKFLARIKKIEKDKTPVSDELLKLMRKEAKEYLPARVRELAKIHNLKVNDIRLKNHKTKWGSCSSKNNINLNINLIRLPNRLIDYIIMHELAHTVHHNHSAEYWKFLEKILPGAKTLDKEMRRYRVGIY